MSSTGKTVDNYYLTNCAAINDLCCGGCRRDLRRIVYTLRMNALRISGELSETDTPY